MSRLFPSQNFLGKRIIKNIRRALGAIGCVFAVACGPSDDEARPVPLCLAAPADASCANVAYGIHNGAISPTFNEIFTRTLQPSCGSNASCHAGDNPQNGLRLDDEAVAYQGLMAKNAAGTTARVIPNDLTCGELIVRLETPNEPWTMPKGGHLPENLLCVIRHWIDDGAQP
jgi:hypothetical protein